MRRQFFGFGEDECPAGQHLDDASQTCVCNSKDDIMVGGRCKDKSTLCGAGTQWVDKDQACVPLTKYMSQQQIEAAKRAGIDLTGKGATAPQPTTTRTAPPPAPKSMLASLFGGSNGMFLVGGAVVGLSLLALMSKRSEPSYYR